jgi:ribosomal protein S18 acetylase RimI-like enzyme
MCIREGLEQTGTICFEKIFMEIYQEQLRKPERGELPERRVEQHPSYIRYRGCHDEVGREWNWHVRPRINDQRTIEAELAHQHTQFGVFVAGGQEVGYYLLVSDDGFDVEVSDFGFYREHRGRGYGRQAFWELAQELFSSGVRRIWLSTRSTNDSRVVDFYSQLGFKEYNRESKTETIAG